MTVVGPNTRKKKPSKRNPGAKKSDGTKPHIQPPNKRKKPDKPKTEKKPEKPANKRTGQDYLDFDDLRKRIRADEENRRKNRRPLPRKI